MKKTKTQRTKKAIFLLTVILIFTLFLTVNVRAGAPAPPTFTVDPTDAPDPVDEGNIVTFTATATDPQPDNWYLAICKTDFITEADPPTCPDGAYCVSSSAVASDTENSCAWTSTGSGAWYGFACDTPLDGCSASVAGDITVIAAPVDNDYPIFSDYQEVPANNTAYSQGATYEFNATITSTNATAGVEFDGTNYTATNLTATLFNATVSDLSTGTYSYYWWAYGNGTSKNFNTSGTRSYTVAQTTGQISLLLNGAADNLTIQYPQESNITASTDYGTVTIYREGTIITGENGLNVTRGSGYYNITSISDGDQNHSSASKTYWLNITKAVPQGSLTNTGDWTVEYPTEVTISYSASNSGDGDLTYIIYRDEVNKGTGETITLGVGNYDYVLNTTGGANYTLNASIDAETLTITQNTTLQLNLTITPSQSEIYGTETTATGSGCPAELDCKLFRDGVEVTNADVATLGVAIYNYTYNTTGNTNYSATDISKLLTITQATPTLTKYLNGVNDNLSISYPQQLNASASTTGGTLFIYRDGTDVTSENGLNQTLGVDYYTYEFNVTENQNYTDVSSVYLYANITQATAQTSLVFDKTSPQTYAASINASCSVISGEGNAVLYRDGNDVTATENNQDITLAVDTYDYECNLTATQNYTYATNQSSFTIDQATGEIFMYVNNSRANFTAQNGTANQNIWLNATLNSGTGDINLYVNGTLYNSGSSPLSNQTNLSIGYYNITSTYSGNTNYTSDKETWWINVTVTAADSPPSVSIVYPENTTYNLNISELNYTASDDINLSACWYSTNNGATNSSPDTTCSNFTNVISTEDSNTWTVYANDSTGQESSDSVTFFKDTIYPTFSNHLRNPDSPNEDQNVQINVTITETNLETVLLEWNGTTNYTVTISNGNEYYFTVSQGNYTAHDLITYYWYANDTANNLNKSAQQSFTVTNQIPSVSASAVNDTTPQTNGILSCDGGIFSDNDDEDTESAREFKWYDGDSEIAGETSQTLALSVSGLDKGDVIKCSVRVNDSYAWSAWVNSSNTATIQNSPPTISNPQTTVSWDANGSTYTYGYEATDADGDDLTWYDNTTLFDINSSTGNISDTPTESEAGTYNILINVSDGTTQDTDEFTYTINDINYPQVDMVYPANTTYTVNVYELNYTYTEINCDSVWWNNGTDNSTRQSCGTNWTGLISTEGSNTWTVYANDTSGNENSSSVTFVKDTSYPAVTINSPLNQTYNTNLILFNITAIDGGGISSCLYSLTGGTTNYSMTQSGNYWTNTNSSMAQGSHTVNFYCNDSSNNMNDTEQETFFIDSIYPLVDFVQPTTATGTYSQNFIQANITASDTGAGLDIIIINLYNSTSLVQSNSSSTSPLFINVANLIDETYYLNATGNDTAGNTNNTETRTIILDNTNPQIYYNPNTDVNNSFVNRNWIFINVTALDLSKDSVRLEWNGINETFDNSNGDLYWENKTGLSDGPYNFYAWINDSSGNFNSTLTRTITVDITNPSITSLTETPTDSPTYSSGATYEFNATIADTNLETILIEFDGTNYTPSNSGDVYNFSITDLAAGTYNYYWYANDTANNINLTETQTYTINNATGDVILLINGSASDQTAIYGTQTNASASTSYGTITLYRDGTDITSENNNLVALGVGYYNYTADSSGDQNHSSASITRFVNITIISSEVNLTLNETGGNVTISQYSSILLNGTLITGDSEATLKLYNNEILINEGTTEVSNLTSFSSVGVFNVTAFYIESQNYTTSFKTWWVNVTEAPDEQNPSVISLTETPSDPASYSQGLAYEFNATVTDNGELDTVLLEFNGINYTAINLTADIYNVTLTGFGVGTYNYSWYANDTSGNVNNTENGNYTINQNTSLQLGLTITPSQSETYGTETTATGSGCPAELTCNLYREHISVETPDTATLGVAVYNYTYNTTGNANYSANSISKLLTINQETGVVYTYVNNSRANKTINQDDFIYLNATLETGQAGENIKLYNNGTLINEGISPLGNLTQFNDIGLHNITTIYSGNTNYTSAYETWWVNVLEVDLTLPDISLIYPTNISYNAVQTELNYTASDNQGLDKCWYSTNNGETNSSVQICGTNFTGLSSGQGSSTWTVYANDTSGNENSSSVTFFVDSIVPTIAFVVPTKINDSSVNENMIEINITASDANLDTIVIKLYNSTNGLIKTNSSINSPFFISYTGLTAGIYYYNATANDSLSNQNSTETRAINLSLPSLTINKPKNETYLVNTSLLLNYSVSNEDSVWYNLDLGENTTIISQTYFNTSAGSHILYLYANNSNGVIAKNVTFFINLTQFEIKYDEWKSANKGNSTNFNEYSFDEIQNLSNITLENTAYGKISFNENINLTDDANSSDGEVDLDTYVNISENRIELNSNVLANLNKSATLKLYNLAFSNPRILRDESVCPSTICAQNSYSGGTLSFNVTHFTIYSSEETPSGETTFTPSGGGGGGGGIVTTVTYECFNDSECEGKDEVCWNHKCVKLFDIKIIDFESPAKLGEFFDFTYLVKGMADINGDVEINFWIGEGKKILTSGSDVIYLGSFEEKIETTKIFLPSNVDSGTYQFFVQVNHMAYTVQSYRTIEIEVEDGIAKIIAKKPKETKDYIYYILGILILIILILLIRIAKKNNYLKIFRNWKEKKKISQLPEKEIKPEIIIKPFINFDRLKNIIKNFINNLFISLKEFTSKITGITQIEKKSVDDSKEIEEEKQDEESKPESLRDTQGGTRIPPRQGAPGTRPFQGLQAGDSSKDDSGKPSGEPEVKEEPKDEENKSSASQETEEKENLQIPKKKFAEQIVEKVKEEIPEESVKTPETKEKKQEQIKPEIKNKSANIIEDIVTKEQEKKEN